MLYLNTKTTIIATFKEDILDGPSIIMANSAINHYYFNNGKLVQKPSINTQDQYLKLTQYYKNDDLIVTQKLQEIYSKLEKLKDKVTLLESTDH